MRLRKRDIPLWLKTPLKSLTLEQGQSPAPSSNAMAWR